MGRRRLARRVRLGAAPGRRRLDELEPERRVTVGADGQLSLDSELPMPSVSLIELLRGV